jgi:DNA-3-methyladenine glycosylase
MITDMLITKETQRKPVRPEVLQEMNALRAAKWLLGKELYTCINGVYTSGIITETEAYEGEIDRACHAYGGRRTERTKVMYEAGGVLYIYLCYGMHELLNIVVNKKEIPEAVLIRALVPCSGKEVILQRRNATLLKKDLLKGPGKVTQGLAIRGFMNGSKLGEYVGLNDLGIKIKKSLIKQGPRIGVDYAGEHARWPYRFWIEDEILYETSTSTGNKKGKKF